MGSEHKGISPAILKIADAKAKLPLLGEIESLNVSVACGVALYEVVRQRHSTFLIATDHYFLPDFSLLLT